MAIEWIRKLAGIAVLMTAACESLPDLPVRAPTGALVAIQSGPLTTHFHETKVGGRAATAKTFFLREPLLRTTWAFGDASIEAAAKAGKLERIHYADYHMVSILGAAGIFEVRVFGEPARDWEPQRPGR
ncbi:MAG: TRL domain-containing protein [Planctomycetota bacterium]